MKICARCLEVCELDNYHNIYYCPYCNNWDSEAYKKIKSDIENEIKNLKEKKEHDEK